MKLSVFLFLAVVGVEGDAIYKEIMSGKDDPGITNKIQAAVDLLRGNRTGHSLTQFKLMPYVYRPLGHEDNYDGETPNSINTIALIGSEDSDAAVASHNTVWLMRHAFKKESNLESTRYIQRQGGWYRVELVTCKHPYSNIQIDTESGHSRAKGIAILKISTERKTSPTMDENGTKYVECDGIVTG